MMGIMGGGYHPASVALISASFEPKNWGRALGFHAIGGTTSFFLAPLVAVAIATAWNWQGSFISLAIPTFALGIALYLLLRRASSARAAQPEVSADEAISKPAGIRLRLLVPFIIMATFSGAAIFSVISFVPLYMVDHFGASNEVAGIFLILVYSSGFWAGPLGGYLSDRLGRVRVMLAVTFLAGPAIYFLNLAPFGVGIGAILVIIGMISYVRMPVAEAFIMSQTSEHNRSTILGIYYFCGMEGSGLITPLVGFMIDRIGFYSAFTIMAASLVVVTLICSFWLWGSRD
jgi:FSR family fosmidomycin resistance protein-like MFS transporter